MAMKCLWFGQKLRVLAVRVPGNRHIGIVKSSLTFCSHEGCKKLNERFTSPIWPDLHVGIIENWGQFIIGHEVSVYKHSTNNLNQCTCTCALF